jgi:antirestriction protein ArdC
MNSDTCQLITDRILEALEAGLVPWRRPWKADGSNKPLRSNGEPYKGVNVLVLLATAMSRGYGSPYWLTFNQAKALGGSVRKGETGTPVVFYKTVRRKPSEDGEEQGAYRLLKHYTVFNLEQVDGVEMPPLEPLPERDTIASCDELVAHFVGALNGPAIGHGGDRACYAPFLDRVQMPLIGQFDSSELYYGTLFHELAHSTGHESRLARQNWSEVTFGDSSYALEELVAEIASAFLAVEVGLELELEQSAAYIGGWLKALKNDKQLVVKAAAAAAKATAHILGEGGSEEPPPPPLVGSSPSSHELGGSP